MGIVGAVDDVEHAPRIVVPRAIAIHPHALRLRYIAELPVAPAPGHHLGNAASAKTADVVEEFDDDIPF